MAHEELLAATELFADAPPAAIRAVAAEARELPLVRGDVLFLEGDVADSMFLVIDGCVAIITANPQISGFTPVAAPMAMAMGMVVARNPVMLGISNRTGTETIINVATT